MDAMSITELSHEQELFIVGLQLTIDYLNAGSTYDELLLVKNRAALWCREYFPHGTFTVHNPDELLRSHPGIFDLAIPSWQRLNSSASMSMDIDEPAPTRNDVNPPVRFPGYSEPTLLDDKETFAMVDRLTEVQANQMEDDVHDDYSAWRVPFHAGDLKNLPVIFHIPEIVAHLARVDPEEGIEDHVLASMLPALTDYDKDDSQMGKGKAIDSQHLSNESTQTLYFDALDMSIPRDQNVGIHFDMDTDMDVDMEETDGNIAASEIGVIEREDPVPENRNELIEAVHGWLTTMTDACCDNGIH